MLFDEVHVRQVYRPPTTSRGNECNVLFPRNKEGKVDVKIGLDETNNQPKKATFKYKREGRLCIRVDKLERKDGTITGNRCPVLNYIEKKIVTIHAYKK